MIQPSIAAGSLEYHHILHILHNAHRGSVAARVGADRTHVVFRNIVADTAIAYAFAHVYNGVAQTYGGLHILAEQMQGEPQGSFPSDARKT